MRSCLAKKILPVIAVFGAACGAGTIDDPGTFSDDPSVTPPGVLCAKGSAFDWRNWISGHNQEPPLPLTWAAIQRENQPWQTIDATEAKVSLNPGERIGLARLLHGIGKYSEDYLEIFFVTAEQAQTAFPCVSSSTKSLHGVVQGLGSATEQRGYLSIGNRFTDLSNGLFTLDGVSPGKTDLVATRLNAPPITIIRRGVDYPNGGGISLLDFGSGEAVWLEPHTLTVNGPNINQFTAKSHIVTQRGTASLLSEDYARPGTNTRTLTMYSVPESKLTNDEVQFFSVDPFDYRTAMVFFRHPADRTVTFGPDPTTATGTHLGTAPNLTLRLDLPSQPEYGAQVAFYLCSVYSVAKLLVTKEYFGGTPPTWSVNVPDLTSVPGFLGGDIRTFNLCDMAVTNVPFVFAPRTTHDGDVFTSVAHGINVVNK